VNRTSPPSGVPPAPVAAACAGQEPPALVVEDLSVWLGGTEVLHDVSFSVDAGQVVGVIGPNGAGKTTLLRVVLGLERARRGRVSVAAGAAPASRASVGYVPQKILFDPDLPLRARDVVALGLDGHRLGVPLHPRRRRRLADEMLEAVGLSHLAEARVGTLSGGEQQRVVIAHALVSRPRLLLLDEPLASLDLRAGQEVVELLGALARTHTMAVMVSAHDMNPLLAVMDGIVYLAGGRAASGSTGAVVRSEVLSELYGHHVDVLRVHGRVVVVARQPDQELAGGGHGHDHLEAPGEPGVFPVR
jgi:zinc/manganese transport system ATP-binding protein